MLFAQCCCKKGDCLIGSDDFNRADSTDIGSNWIEESGDWSIDTNRLREAGTSGGLVLATRTFTANKAGAIDVDLIDVELGDVYEVVMGYSSGSYHWARVEIETLGAGLGARLSVGGPLGTISRQDFLMSVSDPSRIHLYACLGEGWISAEASIGVGGACLDAMGPSGAVAGRQFGLRNGAAQEVFFDNFVAQKHAVDDPACPRCACLCTHADGTAPMPAELTLTVTGDHACSTANGSVTLRPGLRWVGGSCARVYTPDPATRTGCLENTEWDFEFICDVACDPSCASVVLDVYSPIGCMATPTAAIEIVAESGGTCYPVNFTFKHTAGHGCNCCTGDCEPPPWYCTGYVYFTITE